MELVHMDEQLMVMVLAEPADGPSKFKAGETVAWLEDERRIDGTVVTVETDEQNGRHLITIGIDRITPHNH